MFGNENRFVNVAVSMCFSNVQNASYIIQAISSLLQGCFLILLLYEIFYISCCSGDIGYGL